MLDGTPLSGRVLHISVPGCAALSVSEFDESVLALFVEKGGDETLVTVSWYLFGAGVSRTESLAVAADFTKL